ncbi:DUF5694 domain-containing protein [Poritiphilus flavus]|uniref:TraB/GumN family protein n=1 Tax=Poritiphilus flavus TaxID=2697053 RepID=A0A6L9EIT6_9FLAO|nr:DUF5694 domain-containing protein [Poritiphilus flavus]NAS14428.1 hypothetical protein [Poritiphilus flavus]
MKLVWITVLAGVLIVSGGYGQNTKEAVQSDLEKIASDLKVYDSLAQYEVMVVGTAHFGKEVLTGENQKEISRLLDKLAGYNPTKIVLEWEPSRQSKMNKTFQEFLKNDFDISKRENEVFQLGFRLGKRVMHDSLYLFDNQTEFIGSLENFSFDSFVKYAKENDEGFYNKYEKVIGEVFTEYQKKLESLSLYDRILLMNSPKAQEMNARRMHMFEMRVGIGKNWIGPDWLGRFYQRNVRMVGNVLKFAEEGDRIIIIVGDNHKWILDMLFENTPDFNVVSSWDRLRNNNK